MEESSGLVLGFLRSLGRRVDTRASPWKESEGEKSLNLTRLVSEQETERSEPVKRLRPNGFRRDAEGTF